MSDIVTDFLRALPRDAGVNMKDVVQIQKFYSKYIDAGKKDGTLTYQEIFDYIENSKEKLKGWYDQKPSKSKPKPPSRIETIEKVLQGKLSRGIKITDLLPALPPPVENMEEKRRQENLAADRRKMIAMMVKYGYRVVSESELKFEFVGPSITSGYSYDKYVQLRDPSDHSGSRGPVVCLIAEVSTEDDCPFRTLLDRAVYRSSTSF